MLFSPQGASFLGGHVERRKFISILGGAAAWPLAARAQQRAKSRIGVVMGLKESDPVAQTLVAALQQGLQKLGWTQGRDIAIDVRYATDDREQIRALALELMGLKPDLMISNSNLVTATLQAEVRTVPLLFIGVTDPIGSGFVTDFARPTGNITGFANFDTSMGSKWLETLKEIAPRIEHVGFMLQPETPANVSILKAAEAAAPSLKAKVTALGVYNADEIERAVSAFAVEPNRGLIIAPHAVTRVNGKLIVELAARHRLPAVYAFASFAQAGGLVSYGIDLVDQFRQGATYVDRILKGARPAELPVQSATKLELVINLKTAKALGLDVSPAFLARADEVIE
jgi:putative ABC transport system substrate-binding protein